MLSVIGNKFLLFSEINTYMEINIENVKLLFYFILV